VFGALSGIIMVAVSPLFMSRVDRNQFQSMQLLEPLSKYVKSGTFLKLALSSLFIGAGILLPYLHLVPYAEQHSIPQVRKCKKNIRMNFKFN
jgi:ABC-type Fe3+ transport system permease subunit